jgi:short-subunit dehydrogenase
MGDQIASSPYPVLDRKSAAKYGPWAVITGASDGTGESYARQLASLGINIMLIARRGPLLNAVAKDLEQAYRVKTRVLVQDLMAPNAADEILKASSDLDVGLYVSNAGADGVGASFLDHPPARWRGMIRMNVDTVMELTHGFATKMIARGRGGILLMSSGSALGGLPWLTIYAATKSFELLFAEGLWAEVREMKADIDILTVLAPLMDTPCYRRNIAGTHFDVAQEAWHPDDIVRTALSSLPHGPVLMFTTNPGPNDMEAEERERRERVLAVAAVGKSFFKLEA